MFSLSHFGNFFPEVLVVITNKDKMERRNRDWTCAEEIVKYFSKKYQRALNLHATPLCVDATSKEGSGWVVEKLMAHIYFRKWSTRWWAVLRAAFFSVTLSILTGMVVSSLLRMLKKKELTLIPEVVPVDQSYAWLCEKCADKGEKNNMLKLVKES
ncbi:hypothetical protein R1sor_012770 [Riccia sorocarpa]|uniref:Uncharacterized protein n=1 Tax=Riccia sorocarpa TaxID=122646 RepID=A0ABD3I6L0_9MARC